jgi:chemotaxis protein MotB
MAGDNKRQQPIIIKRVRKSAHATHSGAWKIAYADFVTAMMAFFLLMWLMGSLSEGDRKGLADYFNSPMKFTLNGSSSSGTGDAVSLLKGGGQDFTRSAGQIKRGDEPTREHNSLRLIKTEQIRAEARQLEGLKLRVQQKLIDNPRLSSLSPQIKIEMVRDGLRIQIVDEHNRPMFASGSAVVQPYMRDLLREIGQTLAVIPNRLTLEGHTDAHAFSAGERGYSNWELSSDRANASRRELIAGGLPEDRVVRVQGLASSVLYDPKDPLNPQNRRISIIVMNRDAEDRFFGRSTEALDLSDPQPNSAQTAAGSPQLLPPSPDKPLRP